MDDIEFMSRQDGSSTQGGGNPNSYTPPQPNAPHSANQTSQAPVYDEDIPF